jgi:hypothetical protein
MTWAPLLSRALFSFTSSDDVGTLLSRALFSFICLKEARCLQMFDLDPDVRQGQVWIALLSGAGVLNGLFYLHSAKRSATGARADGLSRVFAGIYAFVCAYRSLFMTDTHRRLCFTDTPMNAAIVNRTLAAVAEISFGKKGTGVKQGKP